MAYHQRYLTPAFIQRLEFTRLLFIYTPFSFPQPSDISRTDIMYSHQFTEGGKKKKKAKPRQRELRQLVQSLRKDVPPSPRFWALQPPFFVLHRSEMCSSFVLHKAAKGRQVNWKHPHSFTSIHVTNITGLL